MTTCTTYFEAIFDDENQYPWTGLVRLDFARISPAYVVLLPLINLSYEQTAILYHLRGLSKSNGTADLRFSMSVCAVWARSRRFCQADIVDST